MSFDGERTANFNRPPRIYLSDIPEGEVAIPAPPHVADLPPQNLLVSIIPVLGVGVMALFFVLRTVDDSGGNLLLAVPLVVLAAITVGGSVLAHRLRRSEHRRHRTSERIAYIRLLERKRARLQAAHDAYRAILDYNFRHPRDVLQDALTRDPRIWERRPGDPDFAVTRLGTGRLPIPVRITVPDPDRQEGEELARALRLAEAYRFIEDVPVTTSLQESGPLGIHGGRDHMLSLARAMLCHLALTHAPQDLHIHLFSTGDHYADWRWLTWLPHASRHEQSLSPDLLAFDAAEARNLLGYLSQTIDARRVQPGADAPLLVVVFDGLHLVENETIVSTILRDGQSVNTAALCLSATFEGLPGACQNVVAVADDGHMRCTWAGGQLAVSEGQADRLSRTDAEHLARALASIQTTAPQQNDRIPRTVELLDLYGARRIEDLTPYLEARWGREVPDGVLPFPVPLGRESLAVDTLLALDDDHHGPHGVLAGTTGSGKSELLQSLVCALALEHDPRLLNFLLIDFKGGSTFNVFARLPHTVGMVTNLDGALVKRVLEALKAETQQRQQILKEMNVRDITQYHRFYGRTRAQFAAPDYHPLPHLFVIVDEFAQLAREMPAFLSELVRTAQVGRSLGLHLILGTQSPMDVITDEMNDNLQFRICLRVQNAEASRAMLRRPDAAYLPAGQPGRGYFQVGERGLFKQFQTAYAGGDYMPDGEEPAEAVRLLQVITESGDAIDLLPHSGTGEAVSDEPHTVARAVVGIVAAYCSRRRIPAPPPLLLPPLPERLGLDAVLPDMAGRWDDPDGGPATGPEGGPVPPGSAPIGLVDDVFRRVQYPLWLHYPAGRDTSRAGGHTLITGGVGTGKTMVLRTLLLSLALLNDPDLLHLYVISMMGGDLNDLGDLPHAEQVIHGTQPERVRRLFARLTHTLESRQAGREGAQPIIVVAIDQFEAFRDAFYESHMPALERLINEGHGASIYVVLTATSVTAVPERLRSLMPQRITLALNNPADYALTVGPLHDPQPPDLPRGRGYLPGSPPLVCQICLPGRAPRLDDEAVLEHVRAIIRDMHSRYLARHGADQSPAPVRELPRQVQLDALPVPDAPPIVTPLGLCDDDTLSPFLLDWAGQGPHFLVTGHSGTGKTILLHTAALAAASQYAPQAVRFLFVDFTGRSFRALSRLKHALATVNDPAGLTDQITRLNDELAIVGGSESTHQPRTVIMIDNYDLLSETLGPASPDLQALRDIARQPPESGVHIWAAGYFERTSDPLLRQMLLVSSSFGLGGRDSLYALHLRPVSLPPDPMPPGRACFAQYSRARVVQIAQANVQQQVDFINNQQWRGEMPARWRHEPRRSGRGHPPAAPDAPANNVDIDTAGLIHDLFGRRDED